MKDKNRYFRYINFTPYKLKVFKSENFSIQTPLINKHKTSVSCLNKNKINNSGLNRNPTHNYLFDKININNLSTSKLLLDKSIKREKSFSSPIINNNSKSSDIILTRYNKLKRNKNKYNKNIFHDRKKNKYFHIYKNNTPDKLYNKESKFEYNFKNNNLKPISISIKTKNSNTNYNNNYKLFENEKLLRKIIFIQSFWRSYFLRKLVVGGLEKYYSSIALSRYLNNIFTKNKKILFKYFIESIKEYILHKRYSCFKYNKNQNNVNIFFKGSEDSVNSFEIPNDKKKDCIYFFIKKEQNKINKLKIMSNKNYTDKNKNINIKDTNWKYDKRSRNYKNKMNSSSNNKNKEKFNKNNINIKINLINQNNIDVNKNTIKNNKAISPDYIINNKSKFIHKYKRNINLIQNIKLIKDAKPKNIYSKKIIGEENKNKIVKKENSSSYKYNDYIKNKNGLKKIFCIIKIIKKHYLRLYYLFFINKIKVKIKYYNFIKIMNVFNKIIMKKHFQIFKKNLFSNKINYKEKRTQDVELISNIFSKNNIIYYKKKNNKHNYAKLRNKPESNHEYKKIKVNKNTKIENNIKLKLLNIIIDKKLHKIKDINENNIRKYFSIWKKSYKLLFVNYNFRNSTYNNSSSENFSRQRSQNSKKIHLKIKYKKSSIFNNKTFYSNNSTDKNILSKSCKKMKISKILLSRNNFYSSFSNDIDIKCKDNLTKKIMKNDTKLINKVISLIKIIEKKSIMYKYFIFWKKGAKKANS